MIKFLKMVPLFIEKREKHLLLFLFLLTVLFRTLHVAVIYSTVGTTNWSDDYEYLSMGSQIASGNWTPMLDELRNMEVGPALPFLIAFFIKIFGNPNIPFFIYNIIITSLLVPLLYYLGKEVFNRNTGSILAFWGVFYMDFYKYNAHLLKEPTLFFFVPLTLFLLIKAIKNNNQLIFSILSAFSFVWLIHSDERYFLFFPIFAVIFFLKRQINFKKAIQSCAIWCGLIFILMLPWGIHNYRVFGQVVIISSRTTAFTSKVWGKNIGILSFNSKDKNSSYHNNYDYEFNYLKTTDYKKYGIEPHEYKGLELYTRSFINFWQPTYFNPTYIQHGARIQKWSWLHNMLSLFFYGFFIPLYCIGLILLIYEFNRIGLFLGIIPIVLGLVHTYMIWPLERYRSPIVFIVVMIGIWFGFKLLKKIQEHFLFPIQNSKQNLNT